MAGHGEVALVFRFAASVEEVWSLVRWFGEVATWNPFLASSRLVSGTAVEIGAEREVITTDGTVVREQLVELDDVRHTLGYRMLTFPIPVTGQQNRIVVTPGVDRGSSRATFSAQFQPLEDVQKLEIAAVNRAAFITAANGIGRHLNVEVVMIR